MLATTYSDSVTIVEEIEYRRVAKERNRMSHHVFVPVTDDLIYNHPEQIEGPLVPYTVGMECHEWLSIEINPDEAIPVVTAAASARTANLRLAYSA